MDFGEEHRHAAMVDVVTVRCGGIEVKVNRKRTNAQTFAPTL
jgi:hypothetical protein